MGYWAAGDRDDDISRILVGVKYRETQLANSWGLDEITPVIEYSREWRHDNQSHPSYVVSSEESRPNPNNLIMAVTVEVNSEWKVGTAHNRSLKDRDSFTTAFIRYQPNDNLWLSLSGAEYHGREDTLFGRFSRHDNVSFQVNYKF